MLRLFTGLSLPPEISAQLHLLQGGVPGARWTAEGNYHITLTFIGEVDENLGEDIDEALSAVKVPPFSLSLTGAGVFQQGDEPKVLWMGVGHDETLFRLKEKTDRVFEKYRIPFAARKYTPHVTLARLKKPEEEKLAEFLAAHGSFSTESFEVKNFLLYESRSTADGPVYDPLRSYALG
ncbi:MAG: RNA 2',3'-cyclic phosphodiesterase [Alphaproteobacteria bacterium]|nr:RNA 2',3'-cyclic phosphodiesterase [Alphaproteobacteria bacterium]